MLEDRYGFKYIRPLTPLIAVTDFLSMTITITRSLGAVAVLLALIACAGPPVQEMSDARQAIQAAESAGAPQYAPVVLGQAKDYLASAEQKLEKRAYNGARNDARLAKQKATHARSIAETIGGER
jgi:hypothetical protein